MTSVTEQVRIATEFLINIGKGGIDAIYYADDLTAWSHLMGTVERDEYLSKLELTEAVFASSLDMAIDTTTAQPGRIVLQSHSCGMLATGQEYTNEYLFLFEFNDSDQIRHVREYFDMDRTRDVLLPAVELWRKTHGNGK
jgi:hypothetical protein